jgi:hypothetical protein
MALIAQKMALGVRRSGFRESGKLEAGSWKEKMAIRGLQTHRVQGEGYRV